MLKDYFIFSINGMRTRRLRSWLTMLGIFIGIAAVVSLIGLGEGLRSAIATQFNLLGTDVIRITASGGFGPPGTGVVEPLTNKELDRIKGVKGIEGAAGRIIETGKMVYNKKAGFGMAMSMPDGEDRELIEDLLKMDIEKGRNLKDGDKYVVVLGNMFMQEDNGFGKRIIPGTKVEILDKEFTVVGVLKKKGSFLIDGSVIINEDVLRELVGRESNEYDLIAAKFDENLDVKKIKVDIEKNLRKVRDVKEGEENFDVETPESVLQSLNSSLLAVQIFVYLIAGISLLVGGIGIMNTMYTAVVERTKDIGIMKSIGAKNSSIFSLFFIESGLLGSAGGLIGVILGYSLANGLAFIAKQVLGSDLIAAKIGFPLVFVALLFSFLLGSFFGTLPALQASKLSPVDALRKE